MPWTDWQFWVVTLFAVAGVALIVRPFLPRRPRGQRTTLTIDRRRGD